MRPWSASGAFSAAEYEDAKRRVRRLEPTQALPALDIDGKASRARKSTSQSAACNGQPQSASTPSDEPSSTRRTTKPAAAEATFLSSLHSNIKELSSAIEGRLAANPHLRGAVGADFSELQLHVDRSGAPHPPSRACLPLTRALPCASHLLSHLLLLAKPG